MVLTGLPGSCFPQVKPTLGADKVVHIIMYAGFAYACLWGYRQTYDKHDKQHRLNMLSRTALISLAFGGLTEIMQETICYNRYGNWYDFAADAIGSLFGILLFSVFFGRKK